MASGRLVGRVKRGLAIGASSLALLGFLASAPPAGAAPAQTGGDDVATWQPGWSWTYNTTFVANTSAADVTANETETYTVASTPVVSKDGYTDAYQLNISGTINSCSGSADGYSISNCSGSVTGNAWYEEGDLALIEEDQDQNISATAEGFVGVTASFNIDLTGMPAVAMTDFRLHNGDSWTIDSTIAESGSYSYDASGLASGNGPINGSQPIDATASVATGTYNGTSVDEVTANDTTNGVTLDAYWAPSDYNLAYLNLDMSASGIDITQSLSAHNTPAPSTTISENLSPNTSCAGGPVTVSGTLSSGASGQNVTITTDEEPATPGDLHSTSTTTGSGGAYSANITAPSIPDGLQKGGVRGAFGILVASGSARDGATLEVTPQDCTSVSYTGATSGQEGSSATVSATVTDLATGQPASGIPVTFSLSGQSGTAMGTTGANGQASATLALSGPPGSETLTATAAATGNDVGSFTTAAFTVDKDPSQVDVSSSEPDSTVGDTVTFTAQVSASGPEVAAPTGTVQFDVDGSPLGSPVTISPTGSATSIGDSTMAIGSHNITATYSGDGNFSPSTGAYTQEVHAPLTQTTTNLTATPTSSVYGQAVGLTATVSATSGTPDGQVEFFNGDTEIGSQPLNGVAGNDQASISVASLPVGSDTLTAVYEGDGFVTFNGSTSSPVDETVAQDPTTTSLSLTSPTATPVSGQGLTYQVTVTANTPGSGTPTGTVELEVDGQGAGSGTLSGGSTTITISGLGAGSHVVSALYGGDTDFHASTGQLTQTVDQAHTTTTVTANPNPALTGQAVSITATVAPASPGSGEPSGLITFYNGGTEIGSAALLETVNGDQATIGLSTLPQGVDQLSASFPGDANFLGSTSSAFHETVNPAPPVVGTTTTLVASADPSVYGQAVTWTATVTAQDGSTPTGDVQFSLDGANLGSPVALGSNGQAQSEAVSNMQPGTHTIVAAYLGATTPSEQYTVSGVITQQTVQETPTGLQLSVTPDPAPYGSTLTFSVTVSAVMPGGGTPGGTAQFSLDGQDIGNPVPVGSNGTASMQYSTPVAPGQHTLSVVTSGDTQYSGSNASILFQVNTAETTTSLTASPTSTTFGSTVTLTATVAGVNGPNTPPTGKVEFLDGSTPLATVNLVTAPNGSQQAVLPISTLAVGTHKITAVYQGDGNFSASTSSEVTVTISKAATSLTATPALIDTDVTLSITGLSTKLVLLQPLVATLTSNGQAVGDQPVTFSAGSTVLCANISTNSSGQASCSPSLTDLLAIVLADGYTVSYGGSPSYLASSASAPVVDVTVNL